MRYIHLGIDYGTSASKIVIRDFDAPGGEAAYPMIYNGSVRIPSDVAVSGDRIYFGRVEGDSSVPASAVWYPSVKMRVADQHGAKLVGMPYAKRRPPTGWSFDALAALSVAWLIGQAQAFATEETVKSRSALKFGMTLGVPTNFRHDPRLRRAFVAIAMAAWDIVKKRGRLEDEEKLTSALHSDVEKALGEGEKAAADGEHIDAWIRSEALSSAWWSWSSPAFEVAPYVLVDVGAGTTNVAAFLIRETSMERRGGTRSWSKEGISVLGAVSGTAGMNVLVNAAGGPVPGGFPPLSPVLPKRSELRGALEKPYRDAFVNGVFQRTGNVGPARDQWRDTRVWMLGGGSLSSDVCNVFGFDPLMPTTWFEKASFGALPSDLQLPRGIARKPETARLSLPVAYGLSVPREALPVEIPPGDIEPLGPMTPRPPSSSLAGIYEK